MSGLLVSQASDCDPDLPYENDPAWKRGWSKTPGEAGSSSGECRAGRRRIRGNGTQDTHITQLVEAILSCTAYP
jgi:hypothetical protein